MVLKTREVPKPKEKDYPKGHTTLCVKCWKKGNVSSLTPEAQKRYQELKKK